MQKGLYGSSTLSNSQYHSLPGYYSSSQFKTAIEDIELFYKKYVSKEVVDDSENPAFNIGTYYHTAILEPEFLEQECAVFPGKVRRGSEWNQFKQEHEGKAIITQKEYLEAENLITATKESTIAMDLLSEGEAETSLVWELEGLPVKVRADWINFDKGYILDLKSTKGNSKNEYKTKNKISNYDYDLSAALYLDVFNSYLGYHGEPLITDFYWTFASKDYCNCKTYKASPEMLKVGRAKYRKGLADILKYKKSNWEFVDELCTLEPLPWERDLWVEGDGDNHKKHEPKQTNRQSVDSDML